MFFFDNSHPRLNIVLDIILQLFENFICFDIESTGSKKRIIP